jgi:gliding motility-associated-like protein
MHLRLPNHFLLVLFFQLVSMSAIAQTVCVAPYNPTPASSWGMVQKFQSNALIWNGGTPTAADLNGDGISEILAPANDYSGYYVYKGDGTNKTTATKDFVITTSSTRSVQPAIANLIGNASSAPEVVMVNTSGFVYIFASTGGTESNFLFKSTTASQYNTDVTPYIVDIDQDGTAEIVLGSDVFGIVGNALVKRVAGPALGYVGQTAGSTGTPIDVIVADIISTNPGKELIYGSRVYGVNLGTGVTTILKDLSTIVGTSLIATNDNGPTAIGDMNGDGKLDIVYNGSTFVVIWDPNGSTAANTLLFRRIPPSFNYGTRGLPLIANVFNDKTTGGKATDLPEAVIINSVSGSAGIVTAYNLNYNTTAGTATQHIWSIATNDMSGCTGITAFDFDGNGMREIVYRDQSTLRIINGNLATPVNYATEAVSSSTWGEYPIVADLNNDGQAEIAVTGNNMLQVFGSDPATFPWKAAPTYWNQRNYRIVNVNSNLTIPATEISAASSIAYNNNAAQFQFADAVGNGVPSGYTNSADAQITITAVTTNCPALTVAATISNIGSYLLPAGTYVAMYDANPTSGAANLIGTYQTTSSIAAGASLAVTMTANLVSPSTTVFAVVNDRGTTARPFNLSTWTPNTGINECSYTNNIDSEAFTCLDTDGDSVVDYVDIDDDNDGVLDTSEQSGSCANVTLTPFSATSSPVYGGSTATRTIDGTGFTGTGLAALATAPATLENAWLLKEPETSGFIEYLMPSGSSVGGVALWAPDAFNYGGGDGPPKDFTVEVTYEGGRIFTSQVFTTAQPNSSGALPGAQAFYFPKALFNVTKLRLNILSGWYDINNNSVGQVSTDGITVNAAYNMFLGEFRAICGVADLDTDNDGIPNRLDLDSDGDGCTDAVEAGVTGTLNSGAVKNGANGAVTSTTTLPNAIAAGLYGTNGLANSLEATVDNGVTNYSSTYAYATMRGYAACVDSDNDSINDVLDVDDDNDGVLDLTELTCTSPLNAVAPTAAGATSIFSDNNSGNFIKLGGATVTSIATTLYETNINVVQFAGTSSGTIVLNTTYQQLKIAVADVDQSESITLKVYDVLGNLIPLSSGNILQKGSYVNPTYPAGSSMMLTAAGALTYDGSTNAISNILIEVPYTAKRIEIYKTAGSQNSWVGLFAGCNDGDTDNDGIANRLDLDSDGDGCSDALESGATTSTTANFAFTGTMGANGLDNSLETGGNGHITYTSTYDFANSKNYAACVDTDGDSVTDVADIDDDNDGILDAIESPSCFYTSKEWLSGNRSAITVSTTLAMNATYGNPYKLVDGNNGTAGADYAVNFNASTTAGQTVYAFKMPVPVELKTIYLGYINANTHFNTGTVLRLEGSNDNTSWTTLGNGYAAATSVPGLVGSLTANTFSVTQDSGKYLFYRVYWVSGGGVNANGTSNEVYFETYSTYQASLHPKLDCISDTDGDGTPNHQDLDSDGDACPDAREAGVLGTLNAGTISNKVNGVVTATTNVAGTLANGAYGANGFADALETASENGIYRGAYNYNFARSTAVVVCLDTDNDGVVDLTDLDDDNDGVLDSEECPPFDINNLSYSPISYTVTNGASASQTFPAAPDGLVVNVWTLDNSFNVRINGTHLTNPEELQFWPSVTTDALFEFLDGTAYSQVWAIAGSKAKPLIRIYIDNVGRVKVYGSRTSGGALEEMRLRTGSFNTITLNTNSTNTFQIGQVVVGQTFVNGDFGVITPPTCDDDNDGIPNGKDLDSDGDGCPDAKEAGVNGTLLAGDVKNGSNGAVTSTTSLSNAIAGSAGNYGANGLADVVETATDSGTIRYTSTYSSFARSSTLSVCLDSDGDNVPDVIDIDDDNDGILDSIEQEGCSGTGVNLNTVTFSGTAVTGKTANTITSSNTNSWISSYSTQNFELPISFKFKRPTVGNTAMIGLLPANGTQNSAFYTNEDYKFYFTSTNVQVPFGTTFNVTQTATAQDEYSIDISATGYVTMKINGVQKAAFQGVNSAYKISVAGVTTTVFTDVRLSNPANPLVLACTDTDNDGVPNYLDLDSDGDGCPDAKEANVSGTFVGGAVVNKVNGVLTTTANVANAIASGDYGLNGFADALETASESGLYSGIYLYEFATANSINVCVDSDGDATPDLVDIDDDNDGILDAIESPTCFFTAEEIGKPIAISTELAPYSNYVIDNAIDASLISTAAFSPNVNWVNKEIFKLTALRAIPIAGIKFELSTWAISNGAGNTFKLQGSNNNSTWTDLSGASSSTATTGSYQLSNTISPTTKYKFYRVIGVAGSSYYGGVIDIQFVLHTSYSGSQYPKLTCTQTGLDADSIPNHLDVDSDGDGCSDALEAGTTTDTATDFVFTGTDFGANGFKDGLESSAPESNLYAGAYRLGYAWDASVKACLDLDTDGVADVVDLDDDNDGILDAIESPSCFFTAAEIAIPSSVSSQLAPYSTAVIANSIDGNTTSYSAFDPSVNWVGKELFKFTAKNYIAITGMSFDLVNWAISNGAANTFKLQGSGDDFYWTDLSVASSSTTTTGTYTIANTLAPTAKFKYFRIIGVAGSSYYGGVYEARFNLAASTVPSANPKPTCTENVDNDAFLNHQDLDSDGDNCPDAVEAGVTLRPGANVAASARLTTTVVAGPFGTNGFMDGLETTADAGTYSGTYSYRFAINSSLIACLDSDTDTVPDVFDIDDDNDGVLDEVEQTNCLASGLDLTKLTFSGSAITNRTINTIATAGGDAWKTSYSNENLKLPISLSYKFNSTTGYAMFGLFPVTGTQNAGTWTDGAYKFYPQTSNVYGYFTTAWDFGPIAITPNDILSIDISATGYVTAKVNNTVVKAFQGVRSDYKLNMSSYRAANFADVVLTDADNLAVYSCTDIDTDNDGIPNRLDLDSDGDGCSDAKEASVSGTLTSGTLVNKVNNVTVSTTVANAIVSGTYGDNGFANSIETGAESGVYSGAYTYDYATDASLNACLDTDGDNVIDIVDIDDDNDGVFDLVECPITSKPYSLYTYNYPSSYLASNVPVNIVGKTTQNIFLNQQTNGTAPNSFSHNSITNWKLVATDIQPTSNKSVTVTIAPTASTSATYVFADAMLLTNGTNTYVIDNNTTNTNGFNAVGAWSQQGGGYGNTNSYLTSPSYAGNTATWTFTNLFVEPPAVCDTDGDGTSNALDLDSDGDGCADAVEAGTTYISTSGVTNAARLTTSVIPAPYGANGFANGLETATESGLYKGTYSYGFATDAAVSACRDTDTDGVPDLLDLDDDNDGVLDLVECPTSTTNILVNGTFDGNKTGWTGSANWTYYAPGFLWNSTENVTNDLLTQTFAKPIINAEVGTVDVHFDFNTNGYGFDITSASTASLDIVLNNKIYATISNPSGGTVASVVAKNGASVNLSTVNIVSNYIPTTKIIVKIPKSALSNSNTLSFSFSATSDDFGIDNVFIGTQLSTCDTDGDGIVNSKDLDSDGDGCFDAVEAKTVTSLTQSTVGGSYGDNGFADSKETATESGVYTGTYSLYSRATDLNIKGCLDSDFDGVPDIDDLDDDNDGVLDTAECPVNQLNTNESNGTFGTAAAPRNTANTTVTGGYVYSGTNTAAAQYAIINQNTAFFTASTAFWRYPGHTTGLANDAYLAVNGSTTVGVFYRENIDLLKGAKYRISFWHQAASANNDYQLAAELLSAGNAQLVVANTGPQNSLGWKLTTVEYTSTSNQTVTFILKNVSVNASGNDFSIDDISITPIGCPDFDGDGIPNQLDLDSDGDGCSDANEGYNSSTAQGTDGNQVFGTNPITVDATGKVTTAAYATPNANYLSVGSASVITAQPTDQTTTPGGQAIFASTVTAGSGTTTYQWQLSTDGGTNWSNVTNTSTYAGATTSTLTVSNVTVAMRGYRYRLQLSQSNYVCGNVTSAVAKIAMNNTPSIVDDAKTGPEDTPVTGNVLTNDTGSGTPAGTLTLTNFTVAGVSGTFTAGQTASIPNVGTIQITSTGAYTFTPVANYNGTVPVISYTATDTNGGSDIGDLRISINPVNDPPVAVDDVKSTNENTAVSGNVLTDGTDDSDVDGNTLVVSTFSTTINGVVVTFNAGNTASIPGIGTIVVSTTGSYTFTPAAGYTGAVPAIDYTISDGNGGSDTGSLVITVLNVNDAPLAADDIATGPQGTTLTGSSVLTNDTDVEGNTLTVTGFTVAGVSGTPVIGTAFPIPNVGSITINANGTYTFVPQPSLNPQFTGQVPLITYTVSDGQGGTDTAVLDIYIQPVNVAPTATPDTKTINEDTQATGNVLTDGTPDSDPDANTVLTVTQYSFTSGSTTYTYPAGTTASIPGVGVVLINTNGSYTFTPNANYNGAVPVITYTITDVNSGAATGATVSSTLTITITPINDDPIAVNDDNKTTPEDTPVTVNVLTNDSDLDAGSTLTVTQFTIDGIVGTFTTTATIPGKGTLTVLSTGEFTFTPDPNFNGVVPRITYTVSDGVGTNTAYLNLTVTPVNDPPTVVNETRSAPENTSLTGNVLTDGTDDSDVDGNTLSISQFTIGGVTYPAGSIVELAGVGTIIVNADGTYTFTPIPGYFGTVPTLTYTVSDGNGGTTNGTLAITVTPVNDPPVVVNESLSIQEDATATGNLLTNDTDPEQANSALTISQFTIAGVTGTFTPGTTAVVIPNVGSIVINANGTYTFTPEANYNGIVPAIEYRVSDGQGAFTNGTLTIVVAAVNDAPTVTNDTKSEPVNTPILGNVLTNDRDVEGTALSLTKFTIGGVDYSAGTTATIAGVGTVVMNADGTFVFTPANLYVGTVPVVTYTVTDGTATSTGTLSMTITPIDTDGDGIPDATEKGTGANPRDTDGDTIPDWLDLDADNDGIPDSLEDSVCIGILPCTPTDTDGDGTPDYRDLDSDGDGIADALEDAGCTGTAPCTPTDTDGDGTPNHLDLDADGDGISDAVEKGPTATPRDTDSDGTPDFLDTDSDGDGILDATEGTVDTDGDGTPNYRDTDSDGDGITDLIEGTTDTDGDGNPNYIDTDSDGDGITDAIEKGPNATPVDTDGDGTPDYKDLDSDNDGIPDSVEGSADADSDGTPNYLDLDSDGDGIADAVERGSNGASPLDTDGDGTPNYLDVDSDGDGIPDSVEGTVDTDGDGIPNYLDTDSDGDGILDSIEDAGCTGTAPCTPTDTDGDGTPNYLDVDSDGDGISDAIEKGPTGTPVDTDGDNIPDYLDTDSDGDGITDAVEKGAGSTPLDTDGDGTPDFRDLDSDGDGITDATEGTTDTDGDGTPDYRDLDADGDGKTDQSEGNVDTDGDGTPNFRDLDSDGDGVLDAVDVCPFINGLGSSNGCPPDSDGDGLADVDDSDDDNDGILDTVEAAACSPSEATCDTDGDGIPNILDTDSDGDGISDVTEAGGTDVDKDGKADGPVDSNGVPASAAAGLTPPNTDGTGASNPYDTDSDGDGILDAIEKGTGATLADTDNDTIPDYLETDSDNDGISDAIEKGTGTAVADTDNDGIPDYRDLDSDGDGIPDAIEKGPSSTPVDSDNDGIPNFRDVDSDGDGILDSVEDAACSGITPCTPTDTDGDNTPDYLDVDSDADGIPDAIEKGTGATLVDTDSDGTPDYLDTDSDGDGILDSVEDSGCTGTVPCTPTDTDGDGIPNFRDLDSDGDGISDQIEKGPTSTPANTDGDANPDYLDADSDGDGISDAVEGNLDSDNDGTPNFRDLDSDGDGIPDSIEKGPTATPVDSDNDGTPDYLDLDTDGDGIPDAVEDAGCTGTAPCTPTDTDGDGVPNHRDLDSDGDGIPDSVEKGIDGANPDNTDGTDTPNYLDPDSDNDGISDAIERGINGNSPLDTDGDGTPDYKEVDSDGDGIPDAVEGNVDTDGDGLPDYRDTDSDNDGISDDTEDVGCTGTAPCTPTDSDNDGTPNYKDLDSDGDNKSDQSEGVSDFDGDGTPNYLDLDSDGDGVLDSVDQCPLLVGLANLNGCPVDTDADGIYDIDDLDDDNDGILDTVEAAACSPSAADCDTDGDGIPNRLDPDADNDGINDVRESNGTDVDGDGKVDGPVDADGVPSSTNGGLTPPNTDGTTLPDPYDTDSDGDGISDSLERGPNPNAPVDTDGDGTPDYRDTDSDNDGIPDSVERGTGAAILDTDGDGIPDFRDTDSDNDGITDAVEKGPSGATPLDTDGDGIPNYRDLDSDGDGMTDALEKGTGSTLLNTDGDALPNYLDADSDNDGISDAIEKGFNPASPVDTDGDGIPNHLDLDSDGDGIPDAIEGTTDTDGDGIPNYLDRDSDGDGILDSIEDDACTGTAPCTPTDTDGDGVPNYLDLDSDGDGKTDAVEKGPTATPMDSDGDGIPDYRDVDNLGKADLNVTNKSVPLTGNVSTNDPVPAGTTYGQPAQVAGATLTMNANGTYSFSSAVPGTYVYLISVCAPNQTTGCPQTPLEITVLDPLVADAPVSNNDYMTLEQGKVTTLAVLANDKPGDLGKTLDLASLTITTGPTRGTVVVNADGTITYTPDPYFVGTDSLEYRICDSATPAACQTATVYFTVEAAGSPAVTTAGNDYTATYSGTPVTGSVLTNDATTSGAALTATVLSGPSSAQGTFTLNADGTYSFTPAPGFTGPVAISYEVCTSGNVCAKATLHILVNPTPALVNDTASGYANVPLSGNLSTNDTNPAGSTYGQPTQQTGATLTVNADGTYSFTATAAGTYTYTVPVCAPGQTANCPTQTLTITATAPSLVNDTDTAFANVPKSGNLSTNDTNPAGSTYGQPAQQTGATLTVNADGTYSFTATAAGTYTYTVPVCAPGQTANCPTQTLTITATAPSLVNDTDTAFANVPKSGNLSTNDTNPAGSTYGQPAQQTGATLTVNADGTYSFTATAAGTYTYTVPVCAPGQTTNCPTQTLTITVTAPSLVNDTDTAFANVPKTGNLSTNDTNPAGSTYGQPAQQTGATLTVNADGTYSFTATAAGTYTYTVPVCAPGQTTNCPTQTLTITVTAPSLVNDTNTAFANVPKTGNLSTNDTNPAGATYGQPAQQTGATLTVNADGTYSFTATAAGTYTYTIPVCAPGQTANCPTQTLTITVTAPSLVDDTTTAFANVPKTGNLSTNDTNPAGSTYGQPAQQTGATLTVNADGTYSFTATAAGTYTYTVPVCAPGQTANCPTQTLTITVTAPSLVDDTATALANVPKTGNLSTNDTNPAGSTYGQPAQQAGATLTVNADGTYSFTATAAGTYTYTVPVCAPGQTTNCPTQTLTITVTAPSLVNDTDTALANVPKTGNLSTNDTNPAGSTYGQPAQQTGATLTVNADGTYSFTATAAGTYTYTVPVCAPGQTTNCPTQTLTITVTAPSLVNNTDTALANVPKTGNLSTNDTNPAGSTYGQPAQQTGATLTVNADGTYSFTATAAGTYTYTVPVCAPGQTTNCPTQTLTITVTGNALVAGIDNFQANQINGLTGGIAGNVLANDALDGQPINAAQVVITIKNDGGLTGVVIDKDGNLILPAGMSQGTYVVIYTICDVLNPTNCREAMVMIQVFLPVDLRVTKSVEAPEWFEGDEFTYTIRLENAGKTSATAVVLTDNLPEGLRYVSSVSSQIPVTTQVKGQEITWNMTQLPIAGATDITLKVKAAPLVDGKEQIVLNTVSVTAKERELSTADNTSSVSVRLKAFFIPNTITPNGGGVNDTFEIPGLGRYVTNELVIINRWGDQVFERKNYQNDWGAEGLVSGTYFYILKVTDENGKQESFKGFVEVVKERVR